MSTTPRLTSFWVGTTDLLTAPYGYESCDFPDATVRDAARVADANGVTYTGQRYDDPPFTVVHTVTASASDTVNNVADYINTLSNLYVSDAVLTLCEEGQDASMWTTIRSIGSIAASYMGDRFARVTVTGTRAYAWTGASETLTQVTNQTLPGTYTVSAARVPGELPAGLALRIRPEQATSAIWVGQRSDPSASASWYQDYSACADATALGGEYALITTSAGYASIGTPTTLNADANEGRFRVVGRVLTTSGTSTTYRAASIAAPAVGSTVTQTTTHVHETASATWETLAMGSVDVPSADVSLDAAAGGWQPESVIVNASASNASAALSTDSEYYQTFTLSEPILAAGITLRVSASATGDSMLVRLYDGAAGSPLGPWAETSRITSSAATDMRASFSSVSLDAGTYAIGYAPQHYDSVKVYYDSSAGYAGGGRYDLLGNACGGDLYFVIYGQTYSDQGATVAVQAANASAITARLDNVALIPTDEWAVESTNAFDASAGLLLSATSDRPADMDVLLCNASATGASLTASGTKVWGMPGLTPGVDNLLVIQAYTPGTALPGVAVVDCEVHPRWLHRMGG